MSTRTRRLWVVHAVLAVALVQLAVPAAGATDTITTVAGSGVADYSGDGGGALAAAVNHPRSVAPTADGGFLLTQPWNHVVRKVAADGTITTVAGTGVAGEGGDGGPATAARLAFVHDAVPTPDGAILIADTNNHRIRKVGPDGTITTVAGTGLKGYSGDGGPATEAKLHFPRGVSALPDGGFVFPDSNNHRVRRVWPDGSITTVAGTGTAGFGGDGGPATAAPLNIPFGVEVLDDGALLIVDTGNHRIRKVASDGTITTVAGSGVQGSGGDGGPATDAELNSPHNVGILDGNGFLIADTSNARIRRVAPDGTISTVAGSGEPGFSGDGGPPGEAQLAVPKDVGVIGTGKYLIADSENHRVRRVGPPTVPGPPRDVTATAGDATATVSWAAPASDGGSAVSGYTVTSAPGGRTVSVGGAARSATVTGLVNKTSYTFTVVASNAAGDGPASSASNPVTPSSPEDGPRTVTRLSGASRFATAAAISGATFAPGVAVAYVATGENFPDALAGGAAAAMEDAPVLLVQRNALPAETAQELRRLNPDRVVVLGGPGAVSEVVAEQLRGYGPVTRLSGASRFATAAAISGATFAPGVAVAYVATGENFPDALAGGAAAAMEDAPVLLVQRNALPAETAQELRRLNPDRVVVLGGPGAVSEVVAEQLRGYGPVTRLSGASRFATAAAISGATFAPGVAVAYVATGENFPDALAGGAAAAMEDAPVLLVQRNALPAETAQELRRLNPDRVVVLGGPGAVSEVVAEQLRGYGPVTRLSGASRFATAAAISGATFAPGVAVAYVATGENFPDALAGGAAAAMEDAPVLLVQRNALPAETAQELRRLNPDRVVVLGGPAAVSDTVLQQLRAR